MGGVGWGGGGGGGGYIHNFYSRINLYPIFYCLETPKFVVTSNWLQLSA